MFSSESRGNLTDAVAERDHLIGAAVDRNRQGRGAGDAAARNDVVEQAGREDARDRPTALVVRPAANEAALALT